MSMIKIRDAANILSEQLEGLGNTKNHQFFNSGLSGSGKWRL